MTLTQQGMLTIMREAMALSEGPRYFALVMLDTVTPGAVDPREHGLDGADGRQIVDFCDGLDFEPDGDLKRRLDLMRAKAACLVALVEVVAPDEWYHQILGDALFTTAKFDNEQFIAYLDGQYGDVEMDADTVPSMAGAIEQFYAEAASRDLSFDQRVRLSDVREWVRRTHEARRAAANRIDLTALEILEAAPAVEAIEPLVDLNAQVAGAERVLFDSLHDFAIRRGFGDSADWHAQIVQLLDEGGIIAKQEAATLADYLGVPIEDADPNGGLFVEGALRGSVVDTVVAHAKAHEALQSIAAEFGCAEMFDDNNFDGIVDHFAEMATEAEKRDVEEAERAVEERKVEAFVDGIERDASNLEDAVGRIREVYLEVEEIRSEINRRLRVVQG